MSPSDVTPVNRAATPQSGLAIGGFMGTGKSTVAPLLAARLSLPWVDTDAVLVERFGPIATQFAHDGEACFRERERALVAELCDGEARVVSTGGGVWADARNRSLLHGSYRTLVLTASLAEVRSRVSGDPTRPLAGDLERLYSERQAAYAHAELVLDTGEHSVEQVVEEVLRWLST